jgi:U4/U6.U5 tri-snRNP-associated protein 2
MQVSTIRDFFLSYNTEDDFTENLKSGRLLTSRMSELVKKVNNNQNFKSHVSPHELLQAISLKSNKMFTLEKKVDPIRFIVWFINSLHEELKDSSNNCKFIFGYCYFGSSSIFVHN